MRTLSGTTCTASRWGFPWRAHLPGWTFDTWLPQPVPCWLSTCTWHTCSWCICRVKKGQTELQMTVTHLSESFISPRYLKNMGLYFLLTYLQYQGTVLRRGRPQPSPCCLGVCEFCLWGGTAQSRWECALSPFPPTQEPSGDLLSSRNVATCSRAPRGRLWLAPVSRVARRNSPPEKSNSFHRKESALRWFWLLTGHCREAWDLQ